MYIYAFIGDTLPVLITFLHRISFFNIYFSTLMVAWFVLHQNKFKRFESAARDMQNYRRGYPVSCTSTQI